MKPDDKARLDRLQALVTARTGRRMSQQELLARLTQLGERYVHVLIDEPPRMTAAQLDQLLRLPAETGLVTGEDDVDRLLYGRRLH